MKEHVSQSHPASWGWGKHLAVLGAAALVIWALVGQNPRAARAKRKRTMSERMAHQIANALDAYRREYGGFPTGPADVTPYPTLDELTNALTGADATANPRRIDFLPEMRQLEPSDELLGPGLLRHAEGAAIVDAWRQPFRVLIDADGDGLIPNPQPGAHPRVLDARVLVWSGGVDGDEWTWADNLGSWPITRPPAP